MILSDAEKKKKMRNNVGQPKSDQRDEQVSENGAELDITTEAGLTHTQGERKQQKSDQKDKQGESLKQQKSDQRDDQGERKQQKSDQKDKQGEREQARQVSDQKNENPSESAAEIDVLLPTGDTRTQYQQRKIESDRDGETWLRNLKIAKIEHDFRKAYNITQDI